MSNTLKPVTQFDYQQTLKRSFNDVDHSMTSSGFLVGKVGRKVTQLISTTTVSNDTVDFSYYEDGVLLYTLRIIYTDGSQNTLLSAERIA